MNKKYIKYIIVVILFILCFFYRKEIRYEFFDHGADKDNVNVPNEFIFYNQKTHDYVESYYDDVDEELCYYDEENDAMRVVVDKAYLDNNDVYLHAIGIILNSPQKPIVKVNGKEISKNKITLSSGSERGLFEDIYISKRYNIYIYDTIKENKIYEFYVRIGEKSETQKIIFTSEKKKDDEE